MYVKPFSIRMSLILSLLPGMVGWLLILRTWVLNLLLFSGSLTLEQWSQGKSSSLHFLSMCTEQKHLLFPGKKGWVHWHLIEAKIQLNTRYNAVGRPTMKDWGTLNAHRATAENSCSVLLKWNSELHSPTLKIQYCFMQLFWNQALVLTK